MFDFVLIRIKCYWIQRGYFIIIRRKMQIKLVVEIIGNFGCCFLAI